MDFNGNIKITVWARSALDAAAIQPYAPDVGILLGPSGYDSAKRF